MRSAMLFCLLLLGGCVTVKQAQPSRYVAFAPEFGLQLSAPASELYAKQWQKRMYVTRSQRSKTLLSQLAIDATGKINLAVMTAVGLPVVTLSFDDADGLQARQFVDLEGLNPSYILADIQLIHWPISQLNERLRGAVVTEHLEGAVRIRQLRHNQQVMIEIHYNEKNIILTNHLREYEIRFEEVQ